MRRVVVTPSGTGSELTTRLTALLLVLVTAVGTALRFAGIGDKSLWIDEAFSVWVSREPLGGLWRTTVDLDFHPPLYYVLLHAWLGVGDGEAALRSLSALLSALTVPVVFLIGERLGGRVLGLASSALVAVSPLQVAYAQQARMYALMSLCAALSLLFLLLVLGPPERSEPLTGGRPERRSAGRGRLPWAGFAVATALVMLSHNTGVLQPVAVAVFVGLTLLLPAHRSSHVRRAPAVSTGPLRHPVHGLVGVATGLAAAVVLWLPWLPHFVSQSRRVDGEFWISPPTLDTFLQHWHDLVIAYGPGERQDHYLLLPAAALTVLGVRRLRGSPGAALLLLLLVVVPVAVELLVSLRRPIFFTQTLVWTSIPASVLLAAGILHLRIRPLIPVVAAAALALDAVALSHYYEDDGKEDWRSAAHYVAEHVQADDLVLFTAAWAQIPFDYYYERSGGPPVTRHGLPTDVGDSPVLEAKMTSADLERLDALTLGAPAFWVVYSHDWYTDPRGLVPSRLAASFRAVEERPFTEITVVRYEDVPG